MNKEQRNKARQIIQIKKSIEAAGKRPAKEKPQVPKEITPRLKKIDVVESKKDYRGETSPYWESVQERKSRSYDDKFHEDPAANPDMLGEDYRFDESISEGQQDQVELISDALDILTEKQRQVVELCGYNGSSINEAARQLQLDVKTVYEHLEAARRKIKKYCEGEK